MSLLQVSLCSLLNTLLYRDDVVEAAAYKDAYKVNVHFFSRRNILYMCNIKLNLEWSW